MKKSIVALAVSSAALASISAYAAEDTTVGFYGNIQYAYVTDSPSGDAERNGELSQHDFKDNGSSFGFKGESKIDDANTAFFNVKYKYAANKKTDTGKSGTVFKLDNAYIGAKGDFGTVKAGTFDSIYNDAIQDPIDQFEFVGFSNNTTSDEGKTVAYFSPTISGFQLQLSAGLGEQSGKNTRTKTNTAYTGVAKYSNDLVTVALGYDGLENKDQTANAELGSTYGLIVTVAPIENLSVSGKYEKTSDKNSSNAGQKAYGLAARYGYGMGDIYGSYQRVNFDASNKDNRNEYALGSTYNINSSMYVYVEIGKNVNSDDISEGRTTVLGATYSF